VTRDAVARLPEGVGTRSDVAILLKDSRYIVPEEGTMEALIKALSGTLDCLSAEEDPPARYSPSHKLWVYLHGARLDVNDPIWNIQEMVIPPSKPEIITEFRKQELERYKKSMYPYMYKLDD
jgi:hypothetical protein